MKTEALTQRAGNGMESPSYSVDDISPNSSVVAGVTLTGDWQDVKAVLRTAILLAKNLRTPLFFGLPGERSFGSPTRRSSKCHIGFRTCGFRDNARS